MKKSDLNRHGGFFSGLLFPIFCLGIYIVLIFLLSQSFLGWTHFRRADEEGLLSAIRHNRKNAAYHYLLGRYYHQSLAEPDLEKAAYYYSRSIDECPLQADVWIDLSKAYHLNGEDGEAAHALERAVRLNPKKPDLMWHAGLFWLMNNDAAKALSALKKYVLLLPEKQRAVYDLSWKLGVDNEYILANLVPASYEYQSTYLMYLIDSERARAALDVWEGINRKLIEKDVFISYVDFLIANGLYDDAESVWNEVTGMIEELETHKDSSLIWNPDFENEMLHGGFDWFFRETDGVDVFLDDTMHMTGNRSIGVTFDGQHNPDITLVQQVVRIDPGKRYLLKGYLKTVSITTKNGIFLSVRGHNCKGLDARSDALTGTNFWRELSVEFKTPEDCRAMVVQVRRAKSTKFDNKIEGTAWIDGISLKQQADLLKLDFTKPSGS